WAKVTPQGVNFLHDHESPLRALRDLRALLTVNGERLPLWLADVQAQLQRLGKQLIDEGQRWSARLDARGGQGGAAIRRADAVSTETDATVPWATSALAYLERRRAGGAADECPLPELFAALLAQSADLSITDFHAGMRRLHDRKRLHLLPFAGSTSEIPEPEYALPDGALVWYYAR